MPHDSSFDSTALLVGSATNYASVGDAYDGSAVKVEPSTGQLAQGLMRPAKQFAAQHVNWVLAQYAAIFAALIANDGGHEGRLDTDEALLALHSTHLTSIDTYIAAHSPRIRIVPFTASGTLVVPDRCIAGFAMGCGGGGGGGKGSAGVGAVTDMWMAGAGGGGGAEYCIAPLVLIPATTINVDVAVGGVGATVAGSTGGDGGDTIVRYGSQELAAFGGSQGGRGAVGGGAGPNMLHMSMGGFSRKGTPTMLIGNAGQGIRIDTTSGTVFGVLAGSQSLYIPMQPNQGGYGAGGSMNPPSSSGSPNRHGRFAAGTAGIKGADPFAGSAQPRGGGGGGGGGAGPFGPGGNGGNGNDPVTVGGGTSPQNAGNNTGAGGGGGGSVAYESGGFIVPRNAGNGGSGVAFIALVLESA